ncbi:hypothetical protein [Desulfovibrio sp. UCD-KL4C]|uniref:hypothetical protein n=1 Tax=Desulfovibrio sp. UCD-KL4C TaxID=2578120 RepID=UPI0025BCFBC7|nr:hypothetical protein [Desulfovibrio sp. UCD-KL4C]
MKRVKLVILLSLCLLSCRVSRLAANADNIHTTDCAARVLLTHKNNDHSALNGSSSTDLVAATTDRKGFDVSSGDISLAVLNLHVHQSSGPGGCVMNPSAGFGLDWVLLAIVMLIGFLRSRTR